jgi:GTP-binding protein
MKTIKGKKGENGLGKNQTGKSSDDIIIKVPQGTVVTDLDTGLIIADMKEKDDKVVVANGGRGGRGNTAFKTISNPCPTFSENGEPGETRILKVELKLLADVGLVGLPSVGKSTFLSKVTAAKPKIADYHFTTLSPNLGVCKTIDNRSFVIADLPGLIEGASKGDGLGDKFLKHIERTRVIAHVIDISGIEGRDPIDDYYKIKQELENYNPSINKRPEIVIANKFENELYKENLKKFKQKIKIPVFEERAITGEGLDKVINELSNMLDNIEKVELYDENRFESHILYKFREEKPFSITKEDDTYVIRGKEVEKLFKMTKFNTDDAALRFANKLRKMGIDDELKKMGCQDGDEVRILDYEFEFSDSNV